jgi:hypothetical protein
VAFWNRKPRETPLVTSADLTVEEQTAQERLRGLIDDNKNRRRYSFWLLWAMCAQIIYVDVFFTIYAVHIHWQLPAAAISTWVGATVVQVVGVVLVITHYLFPNRDATAGGDA